jgi:RNA polymerase-binding transcription factor DksA
MKLLTKSPVKPVNTRPSHGTRAASEQRALRSERSMKQREKLLRLREALSERIRQLAGEACEEIPSYSMHMGDAATDSFDRDLTLGLVSFEQEALYEIDAALKRIDDGTYGICELTDQPIPWARLVAIPWARFSLGAKKRTESGVHPHIGELGTVGSNEYETSEEEILETS